MSIEHEELDIDNVEQIQEEELVDETQVDSYEENLEEKAKVKEEEEDEDDDEEDEVVAEEDDSDEDEVEEMEMPKTKAGILNAAYSMMKKAKKDEAMKLYASMQKAASDLKNGRGDAKTNISKIIYYGAVQNLIFNALQQALFAIGFGDEEPEDEEKQKKYINIANGMLDSLLRGAGIGGSIVSVGKNAIIKLVKELEKDRPKLQNIASEIIKISPPVSAKYSRLVQAGKSYDWNKEEMKEKGLSLDNPAYLAGANVVSALTNIPLDRVIKKANNVVSATSQDLETWERLALLGGWQDWEIGIEKENKSNKPQPRKVVKKKVIKKKLVK